MEEKLRELINYYRSRSIELEKDATEAYKRGAEYTSATQEGWASCYKFVADDLEQLLEGDIDD